MTTTIDSPAAARRRLRLALRSAREAKHLTQAEVAEELEWSISKVNRIENGEVTISLTDLRALITFLGISDGSVVDEMTRDARTARKRGWWDESAYRPHLTPAMQQLIQYEAEAIAIRYFQPTLIPGVLQTAEYAKAVLDFWTELPAETRATRQEIRARRSKALFGQPGRGRFFIILDESVILREVGGPAVMADQLRFLLDVMKTSAVPVRIVPLADGALISQVGDFTILDLDADENAILYREAALEDNIRDDRETLDRYRRVFEQMWDVALGVDESTRLVEANAAIMIASLDRARRGMHGTS
jgi:transcriptional regulator with XRE-family HTH domain